MLVKYIKSVLLRVAKRLSYTEDARCLKVNDVPGALNFRIIRLVPVRFDFETSGLDDFISVRPGIYASSVSLEYRECTEDGESVSFTPKVFVDTVSLETTSRPIACLFREPSNPLILKQNWSRSIPLVSSSV